MGSDLSGKIQVLGTAAQYDLCGACFPSEETGRKPGPSGRWIYPAVMPDGRTIMLLKTLMSNACENECAYCANRCGGNLDRATFSPEELARLFMAMYERGMVKGLFLSSAVANGPTWMMGKMLAAVELLRFRYRFAGYIHLKLLPGADYTSVEQAVRLAHRVSVNLEVPGPQYLAKLTGRKEYDHLFRLMGWVKDLQRRGTRKAARTGQTTQFMVGAAGESDREILATTDRCYADFALNRVYYSVFQPVAGTPLERLPAVPLGREHRLYQSDFLLRRYGFGFGELCFDRNGNLPLADDPKTVWAKSHPDRFPVEVNTAPREELMRIPGIGPVSAGRIVKNRKRGAIRTLQDLKTFGAVTKRTVGFILLDGRRPRSLAIQTELEL